MIVISDVGTCDPWLIKYDTNGHVLLYWTRRLGISSAAKLISRPNENQLTFPEGLQRKEKEGKQFLPNWGDNQQSEKRKRW